MGKDNIFVDTKELNKIAIELKGLEKEVPGAVASALNRTVDTINTSIARMVTQEYAIKAGDVKKTIKKHKAQKGSLSAGLVSRGHTLSLAHFQFTPKQPGKKTKVKVKIKRQGGKKVVNTSPAAFVASTGATTEDKTQYNVFHRVGDKRLPIKVIRTLSIPQMIGNDKITSQVQEVAQKKLDERIKHEIEFRLDKAKKKIKG